MIPQAGSAYAYSYATLGELDRVDHRLGSDPRIRRRQHRGGDRLERLLHVAAVRVRDRAARLADARLSHGAPQLGSGGPRPAADGAAASPAFPILLNIPAALIVLAITWLLYIGVRESARANNVMVVVKLLVLGAVRRARRDAHRSGQLQAVRAERVGAGFTRARRSSSSPTSASTRSRRPPRRRRTRSATCRSASSAGWRSARVIYVIVGIVATGLVPYQQLQGGRSAGARAGSGRPADGELDRGVRRGRLADAPSCWCSSTASRASSSRWRATGCCRRGPRRSTRSTGPRTSPRWSPGVVVALGGLVVDENEIYDLTNIGTLCAFAIVCVGVLVLRYKDPDRPRPFRVPFVWPRRGRWAPRRASTS